MSRFKKRAELRGLVITSKESEQVIVNNGELLIEIVEIKGKAVRLAFQASSEISIRRKKPLRSSTFVSDTSGTQEV